MRRVIWTPGALRDLSAIRKYIREYDSIASRALARRFQQRMRTAASHPQAGRVVPEVQRDDVRELIEGSYRLIYRIDAATIRVLTIFHNRRQPLQLDQLTTERQ